MSPWKEGSPRLLSEFCFEQFGTPLPPELMILVTRRPEFSAILNWTFARTTLSGRHFSRSTYKFYGAWWLRVATWRCFSGFMV